MLYNLILINVKTIKKVGQNILKTLVIIKQN